MHEEGGKKQTRSKTEHRTVQEVYVTGQRLVADTYIYFSAGAIHRTQSCGWDGAAQRQGESPLTRGHTTTMHHDDDDDDCVSCEESLATQKKHN